MSPAVDLIGLLVVLLAIACTVLFLLTRLRLPPVVGYLVSGVVFGPYGLGLISGSDPVRHLAEIGVLLLMFTLGLEFDTTSFRRFRAVVLGGGSLQLLLTLVTAVVARAALRLGLTVLVMQYVMPRLLQVIASARSPELLLLSTLTTCFGMAWLSHLMGVSYALGAFLAGLILGGSEYAQQMTADLAPFREVLSGIFFVAMGMLLNPVFALDNWVPVTVVLAIILVAKTAITTAAVSGFGYPLPVALQVGINLAQIGEFSFLIALLGVQHGLITQDFYQVTIAASIVSMIVAPVATRLSSSIASAAARATNGLVPPWARVTRAVEPEPEPEAPAEGHIVILGYGTVGRTLGEVLVTHKIPFVALEIVPILVGQARRAGHPVRYGDAGSEEMLRRAGLPRARTSVVTLPDP